MSLGYKTLSLQHIDAPHPYLNFRCYKLYDSIKSTDIMLTVRLFVSDIIIMQLDLCGYVGYYLISTMYLMLFVIGMEYLYCFQEHLKDHCILIQQSYTFMPTSTMYITLPVCSVYVSYLSVVCMSRTCL